MLLSIDRMESAKHSSTVYPYFLEDLINPANIYLFKVAIKTIEKGVKRSKLIKIPERRH